jgi:hypothetical protein
MGENYWENDTDMIGKEGRGNGSWSMAGKGNGRETDVGERREEGGEIRGLEDGKRAWYESWADELNRLSQVRLAG